MNAIEKAISILRGSSGLDIEQAKLAIYYAIATWKLPDLQIFPILRFCGPPGTGKTSAILTLAHWCRSPKVICGKLITPAALRDELKSVHMGTAIIEEADETTDIRDSEQLLAARCSPTTGKLRLKEQSRDTWQQVSAELYGASIIHYRRALIDQATNSRTITIETRYREGAYRPPRADDNLGTIFQHLGEVLGHEDMADCGTGRVHDIWAPILAVARLAKDNSWIEEARARIQREIEDLRDGHAYEIAGMILSQVIEALTDEKGSHIICHQLKVQGDIIEPLYRRHQSLNPWQVSRQLKELGFILERVGGQNKFTPTIESLKHAAEKIGYHDALLD
jgi:hypothetical protein